MVGVQVRGRRPEDMEAGMLGCDVSEVGLLPGQCAAVTVRKNKARASDRLLSTDRPRRHRGDGGTRDRKTVRQMPRSSV